MKDAWYGIATLSLCIAVLLFCIFKFSQLDAQGKREFGCGAQMFLGVQGRDC